MKRRGKIKRMKDRKEGRKRIKREFQVTEKDLRDYVDRGHSPSRFKYRMRDNSHVNTSLLFILESQVSAGL